MAGGFHLRLVSSKMETQAYPIQALSAALDRDTRLLSLRTDAPDKPPGNGREYSPLDHVVEAALDIASLCALSGPAACGLLPERSALADQDGIHEERALRSFATRGRLGTFDQGLWGQVRLEIGVPPEMLTAPALQSDPRPGKTRNVVVFVNDRALGVSMLGDVTGQIETIVDGANVIVKDNRWPSRLGGSEWLESEVRDAICHVHLGQPFANQAYGRLIDSAACLLPVILFADDAAARDPSPADLPEPPCLLNEIHFMKVTSAAQFGTSLAELMHDAALRTQLMANATILCREYNAQVTARILSFMLDERGEPAQ